MASVEITVDGRAYPCRPTMGAMLRFKRETGREVSEIAGAVSDMCVYLWCCVVSSCRHDGIEFGYGLDDFADALTVEDITAWNDAVTAEDASAGEPAGGKK